MDQDEKHLNSGSKFGDFIACDCNIVARSTALAIANCEGEAERNPFIIIGRPSFGKTHLLKSMISEIQNCHPEKGVILLKYEREFLSNLTESLNKDNSSDFLKKFESIDYLFLDNFNLFLEDQQTQHAIIQIFESRLNQKKQIVIASSLELNSDQVIDKRLLSLINRGLTISLDVLTFEDRLLLLRLYLLRESINQIDHLISAEILEFMAQKRVEDIRSLEAFFVCVLGRSAKIKEPIEIKLVEDVFQRLFIR